MSVRKKMIAKLHVAKKALALTEESYRDVLRRVTGQESASVMTDAQIDQVLREFKRLGFRAVPARRGTSRHAQIRMIHAVWKDICDLGVDAEDHAAALRAFVTRQTRTKANPSGVSAAEFLDSVQANRVLEGLKAWRTRLRAAAAREVAA